MHGCTRVVLLAWLLAMPLRAGVLVTTNSSWQFYRGYSEASSPDPTEWRQLGFDDSLWESGRSAFYFENQPGSATAYTGNTVLSDMFGTYSCVFLRQRFVVTNIYDVAKLQVVGFCDDGFIAWLNGTEVARFNMPTGTVAFDGMASAALTEPISWYTNTVTNFQAYLMPGTNVLAVQAFNNTLTSSDFVMNPALYYTADVTRPTVTLLYPATNAVVRQLNSIEIGFSEVVNNVEAADLLINGQPATGVTPVAPGQFVFTFTQPPTGAVSVAWASGHNIRDLSYASNLFAGGSWSYTLDPNAPLLDVFISEFMANNSGDQTNSVHDELGGNPDWIELYNNTGSPVTLTGWSLTDDTSKPQKWRFPATVLPAASYLLVFASGRDTNVFGQLHTNFKLSSSPGYLALVDPAGNVISAFLPLYPQQFTDVSYGRDRLDPTLLGYFTNSTPKAANATRGTGFGPDVVFSYRSGTFLNDFLLTLSTSSTNCDIRYVTITTNLAYGTPAVTNIPTATSPAYTGPILVNNTVQVRARAFPRAAGMWPGPPHTENYVKLTTAAATFTSDLPILLLHNLAGGGLSSSVSAQNQSVIVMLFEPVNGRSSLTNPPTLATRGGFNIRGRSTAGLAQYNLALELWDEYNQDNKMEVLGMPAESDWVLYAQDGWDPSYLHNPLMHQLARDNGHYSARTRYAEAFLNLSGGPVSYGSPVGGNYFGLYTIEEKIKQGKERLDIEKLEPQITNAPAITGGYLLKIDDMDANERSFNNSYLGRGIIFQDPPGLEMVTTARRLQTYYISNYFNDFGNMLASGASSDPATGYPAYIEVLSWVDNHIMNAMAYNVDAFRLSGNFFKDRSKKLEMGPLWDFDRSLGTYYGGDYRCFNPRLWRVQASGDQGTDYFGALWSSNMSVRWWQDLFSNPDFWQAWIDRWTELRAGVLSTNHMFAVIDGLARQLTQASTREAIKFSYTAPRSGTYSANGYTHYFAGGHSGEAAFLKRWLGDRVNFIDTNFLTAPVLSIPAGPVAPGTQLTLTATSVEPNTTIYYTLDGTDPRWPGGSVSPYAYAATSPLQLTVSDNVRVFARSYNPLHHNVTGGYAGNPPLSSPWSGKTLATYVVATPALAITEIMYHPAGSGTSEPGDFEFVELKNVGATVLSLPGIRFTNGIQFTFSSTNDITSLAPGEYCVLVKNRAAFASRYPTVNNIAGVYTGSLGNGGEHLYLEGALQEPILDFKFQDAWYPVTDGAGFSLVVRNEYAPFNTWSNAASWRASTALNGSPGRPDPAAISMPTVFINEVLTHTDPPQVDTVELYNPTGSAAPIGGWFLTDDHQVPMKYRIPTNTVVPANGYILFTESQFNNGTTNGFALSSLGEEIYLFSGDGTNITGYQHGFEFGPQVNGVTFGRVVTSDGVEHLVTETANTLGGPNSGPAVGPVVLNEIMFAPAPFGSNANNFEEYIELRNSGPAPALLYDPLHPTNSWRLRGGVQYTFPQGAQMAPWSYALVVGFDPDHDPAMLSWFRSRFTLDPSTPVYGPYDGKLANEGDRVGLYMPDKPELPPSPIAGFVPYVLVEEVHYSNHAPWPTNVNETGYSLNRLEAHSFSDEPANWSAGTPSPGQSNPAAVDYDSDHDGLPDDWERANGLDPFSALGTNGASGDPDQDGFDNWHEFLAGTSPTNSLDCLRFEEVSAVGSYCLMKFTPRAARIYSIERLTPLGGTNAWITIIGNITGTNPYSFYDPLAGTGSYYRIKATKR